MTGHADTRLRVTPITLAEANEYVARHHRHHKPTVGHLFSVAVAEGDTVHGALGYRRLLTYTLASEPGASLRAAGWRVVGETTGRSWDAPGRPRVDWHPTLTTGDDRIRWEAG